MIARLRSWVPDILMCAGACTVSFGVGLVHLPAGVVMGGGFALAAGWLLARGGR